MWRRRSASSSATPSASSPSPSAPAAVACSPSSSSTSSSSSAILTANAARRVDTRFFSGGDSTGSAPATLPDALRSAAVVMAGGDGNAAAGARVGVAGAADDRRFLAMAVDSGGATCLLTGGVAEAGMGEKEDPERRMADHGAVAPAWAEPVTPV